MKLFANQGQIPNFSSSDLFQHFQLFVIKETNTNIFHYIKFLKGKANTKQKKGIKEALYYIKDFYFTMEQAIEQVFNNQKLDFSYKMYLLECFLKGNGIKNL